MADSSRSDAPRAATAATVTVHRWWTQGDDASCVVCAATYAYEIERRCAACDRGLCPDCVVVLRVTSEVLCHECAADEDDG